VGTIIGSLFEKRNLLMEIKKIPSDESEFIGKNIGK
jgi:hypothetical protein